MTLQQGTMTPVSPVSWNIWWRFSFTRQTFPLCECRDQLSIPLTFTARLRNSSAKLGFLQSSHVLPVLLAIWRTWKDITTGLDSMNITVWWVLLLAWISDELSPAHKILVREVRSGITPLGRNYLRTDIAGPIKLSRRALYDDGQMINSNVINHVTKELKCGNSSLF